MIDAHSVTKPTFNKLFRKTIKLYELLLNQLKQKSTCRFFVVKTLRSDFERLWKNCFEKFEFFKLCQLIVGKKHTMVAHKVIALVSGGKDSCYSMMECLNAGHSIVGLANLYPKDPTGACASIIDGILFLKCFFIENELDSYMYQTVGHQAIHLYAEAMGLPLFRGTVR